MNTMRDIFQRVAITQSLSAREIEQERKLRSAVVAVKARISHQRESKGPNLKLQNDLDGRLLTALQDYREFESGLYAGHPKLEMLRAEAEPVKLEEAAHLVPDSETVLLQFAVADTKTYLFVLTRSGTSKRSPGARLQAPAYVLNAYLLGIGRGELAERISKFRELIARQDEIVQSMARELHDLLLAPAAYASFCSASAAERCKPTVLAYSAFAIGRERYR